MTQFNQELITKARKGEIAILNDGSVEELRRVCSMICADHFYEDGSYKYYQLIQGLWYGFKFSKNELILSVKEFFMPNIKDKPIFRKENEGHQPRTYKVTRQQMHELYSEGIGSGQEERIFEIAKNRLPFWENEATLFEVDVAEIVSILQEKSVILRSIWPEYFHIPAGEPVLVRDLDEESWKAAISDGKGGVQREVGGPSFEYIQIIPFTKNPPK